MKFESFATSSRRFVIVPLYLSLLSLGLADLSGPRAPDKGGRKSGYVVAVSRAFQLEQLERVGPPDLDSVFLADGRGVEPDGGMVDVLERPVGGEQDAIGAHRHHGVEQRGRVK